MKARRPTLRPRPSVPRTRLGLEWLESRRLLAVVTFDGGPAGTGNDWHVAANWSGDQLPQAADDAVIPAGFDVVIEAAATVQTLSVDAASTLELSLNTLAVNGVSTIDGAFTQSGGTLQGTGNLTFTGTFDWMGGTMAGTGQTIIAASGNLQMLGGTHQLNRFLRNDGTAVWSSGDLAMSGGNFRNNGSFTANTGATLEAFGTGGTNMFQSASVFTKLGAGTVRFRSGATAAMFLTSNTVDVLEGKLQIDAGGGSAANMTVATGATIEWNSGYTYHLAGSLTGGGTVSITAGTHDFTNWQFQPTGTIVFSGGTVTVGNSWSAESLSVMGNAHANLNGDHFLHDLNLSATLSGNGNTVVTGTLEWTGGSMAGSGQTVVGTTGSLNVTGSVSLGRLLQNEGTAHWTAGTWTLFGGIVQNVGEFVAESDSDLLLASQSDIRYFNNEGSFIKRGTGVLTFELISPFTRSVRISNAGTVEVEAGGLHLLGGGTNKAAMTVHDNAVLRMSADNSTENASISGAGWVIFSGGTHLFAPGHFNVSGDVSFSAGSVTLNDPILATIVDPIGSSLGLNVTQTFEALAFQGGVLRGNGDITITGTLNWRGNTMSGSGTTTIAPGATLNIDSTLVLDQRTLINDGQVDWKFANLFLLQGGTLLNNGAITVNNTGNRSIQGIGTLENFGSIVKLGTGTLTVRDAALSNFGPIDVQLGRLVFEGGISNAPLAVQAGATLQFDSGYVNQAGTTVSGAGAVEFLGGPHHFAPGQFLVTGPVTFGGGTITIDDELANTHVTVSGGTVQLNAPQTIAALTFTNGTLFVDGNLTVTDTFNWRRGTLAAGGKAIVGPSAILTMSGPSPRTLSRDLRIEGSAEWTGGRIDVTGVTIDNYGLWEIAAGTTTAIEAVAGINVINNYGSLQIGGSLVRLRPFSASLVLNNYHDLQLQSGTLEVPSIPVNAGIITVHHPALIYTTDIVFLGSGGLVGNGRLFLLGNLTGNTINSNSYSPVGTVRFIDAGNHQLEAMSRDLGPFELGYVDNFDYGTLVVDPESTLTLIDDYDNAPHLGPEAVYVDTLIVYSNSTLDLNGLNLYARNQQIAGTVINGTVTAILPASTVVGRHLFYNQSKFDGNTAGASASDDGAIAPDKSAYLPGNGTATFDHISSYTRGINGIMLDMTHAPPTLGVNDFTFKVGANNAPHLWADAAAPSSITIRPGEGVSGSDRVTLIWDTNDAPKNTWLQVTARGDDAWGGFHSGANLAVSDIFYFGSRIGDTGSGTPTAAQTTANDEIAARNNTGAGAAIVNVFDFDRSGTVTGGDAIAARNNVGAMVKINIASPAAPETFPLSADVLADGEAGSLSLAIGLRSIATSGVAKPHVPLAQALLARGIHSLPSVQIDAVFAALADEPSPRAISFGKRPSEVTDDRRESADDWLDLVELRRGKLL